LPHLPSNAQWVSLQHEVRPADQEALKASSVLNVAQDLRDFADTAALVANLDLVVSVDTSVAHLSAALGVPTWVLLPRSPDFRWLLDRPDSPWYAAMTLYRQHAFADWSLALERLAHDLRQACASGSFVRPQAPS
jgi:ADP-heptose:LPS heptosyltransferase